MTPQPPHQEPLVRFPPPPPPAPPPNPELPEPTLLRARAERERAVAGFFNALTGVARKCDRLLDIMIEQEEDK